MSAKTRGWMAVAAGVVYALAFAVLGTALFKAHAFPNLGQRLLFIEARAGMYAAAMLATSAAALLAQPLALGMPSLFTGARGLARAGGWLLFAANLAVLAFGLVRGLRVPALAHTFANQAELRTEAILAFQATEGMVFGLDMFLAGPLAALACGLLAFAAARTPGAPRALPTLLWATGAGALVAALEELRPLHSARMHPGTGGFQLDYNYFTGYALILCAALIVCGLWAAGVIGRRDPAAS